MRDVGWSAAVNVLHHSELVMHFRGKPGRLVPKPDVKCQVRAYAPIVLCVNAEERLTGPLFDGIVRIAENKIRWIIGQERLKWCKREHSGTAWRAAESEGAVWPLHRQFIVLQTLHRK